MPKSLDEQLAEVRRAIPAKDRSPQTSSQDTAPIHDDFSAYRPITPQEHAFLTALLHLAQPDATTFLPQLEGIRALPNCTCGCPSMRLGVSPEQTPVCYPNRFVYDGTAGTKDDPLGIILFQAGGKLTELEIYAMGHITGPFGFPPLETIQSWG